MYFHFISSGEDDKDKCAKNVNISIILHALKLPELKTCTQYFELAPFSQ